MVMQTDYGPVLMFEVAPTPPLSPFSEAEAMVVPQLPGTPSHSRKTFIGGDDAGDDTTMVPGWGDLYSLMSELPELACAGPIKSDGADCGPLTQSMTPAGSPTPAGSAVLDSPWSSDPESSVDRELEAAFGAGAFAGAASESMVRAPHVPALRADASRRSPSPSAAPAAPSAPGRRTASARIKARRAPQSSPSPAGSKRGRKATGIKRESSPRPAGKASQREHCNSPLPAGHKPARGRGRQLQLAAMSAEQKKAEAKARLEKNRQAAREFRMRRKEHVHVLETQVADFEARELAQAAEIAALRAQVAKLQQRVAAHRR